MARDPELLRLLTNELARHLVTLEAVSRSSSEEEREVARRTVHALKGSAGLAGEPELASAMQRVERRLREGESEAIVDAITTVRLAIERLAAGETAVAGGWPVPPIDLVARPIDPIAKTQYIAEVTDRLREIDDALALSDDLIAAAKKVYRHVHTMKGAASAVADEPMAWFCHGLEERIRDSKAIDSARHALGEVARYRAVLGGLLDDPEAALATLRGVPLVRKERHDEEGRADGTIRVPAQSVDRLLDHVGRIAVARERVAARVTGAAAHARSLRRLRAELAEALRLIGPPRPWGAPAAALRRIERASHALAAIGDELDAVSDNFVVTDNALKDNATSAKRLLGAMRHTPIRDMFARLAASATAEAKRTGRLVAIRTVGSDEPVDRRLAEQLFAPCLQLTRNAIAHGIEPPDEREAAGKPREATITFAFRRSGNRLAVTISDDGAGADVATVRARAVAFGLVTETLAEAADDQTLLELLFVPGFSTRAQSPDLLAGRGIGLDITLAAVQKLGGTIRLTSRHHRGFEARVELPIESGLATVLWVGADGAEHAIPAVHARRIRKNDGADAERVPHLAACLEPRLQKRAPFVVDIDVGLDREDSIAVGVDTIGNTEEVLVRALSPLLLGIGPFAGAIVRGDGSLRLALDVHALAPRARALGRVPEGRVTEPPSRPPPPSRR